MRVNVEWYLWRPVLHNPPLCAWKELKDGTYSLNDLADMHDALTYAHYRAMQKS